MASQWIQTDEDALGRLAVLWDAYYVKPNVGLSAEIRLQEQRFGLSPTDRVKLQWEVARVERKRQPAAPKRMGTSDPRDILTVFRRPNA
jgi:hypothetical protein